MVCWAPSASWVLPGPPHSGAPARVTGTVDRDHYQPVRDKVTEILDHRHFHCNQYYKLNSDHIFEGITFCEAIRKQLLLTIK